MAFGFFKKNNFADTIFINGNILTQDAEFPSAEAVACKDGFIQAVGDNAYMEEFQGPDTEVIDLDGKFMYPGFINTKIPFVFNAFKELCLKVDAEDDLEYVLQQIEDYVCENPEMDTYFVFGFDGSLVNDISMEDMVSKLDALSEESPLILLDEVGTTFRMNTLASQILAEAAEEECIEIITLPYVINLFLPFDYEKSQEVAQEIMNDGADMGFTSILTLGTPSYMNEAFLNALLQIHTEEELKQRFFFSLLREYTIGHGSVGYALVDRQTSCVELGNQVKYNFLNVRMTPLSKWDENSLFEMITDAAERNFDVWVDCPDEDSIGLAYQVLDNAREAGFTKPTFVIGIPADIENRFSKDFIHGESILTADFFDLDNDIFVKAHTTQEALDNLTTRAASLLNMSSLLGSIEPDKYADFTVFDENILDFSLTKFTHPHCAMTIVGGEVMYDAQVEAENEMFDMISMQQF